MNWREVRSFLPIKTVTGTYLAYYFFWDLVWAGIIGIPALIFIIIDYLEDGSRYLILGSIAVIRIIVMIVLLKGKIENLNWAAAWKAAYGGPSFWYDRIKWWVVLTVRFWIVAYIIWKIRYPLLRVWSHLPKILGGGIAKKILERWPKKKHKRTWQWLKTYGIAPIIEWMRSRDAPYMKMLVRAWTGLKNPYINDTLPFAFRQLRAELMMQMNYMTRLHTYFGKMGQVTKAKFKAQGIEGENFASTPRTYYELSYVIDKERVGSETSVEGTNQVMYGWGNNIELIDTLFQSLKEDLENPKVFRVYGEEVYKAVSDRRRKQFEQQLERMKTSYSQFMSDTWKFGLIHRLRSTKLHVLDLYDNFGVYRHYYRFAHENSIYELWEVPEDAITKGKKILTPHGTEIEKTNKSVVWSLDRDKLRRWNGYDGYIMYKEVVEQQRKLILREKKQKLYKELKEKYTQEELKNLLVSTRMDISTPIPNSNIILLRDPRVRNRINTRIAAEFRSQERQKELKYSVEAELTQRDVRMRIREKCMNPVLGGNSDYGLGYAHEGPEGNFRHEVDVFGFVLADIHAIEVERKDLEYIRRVRIEDIEDLPDKYKSKTDSWTLVYQYLENEWTFFLEDLRFGQYHPNSRSDSDYIALMRILRTLDLKSRTATGFDEWLTRDPQKGSPLSKGGEYPSRTRPQLAGRAAFDLEALRHSGKWVYWGRKNYWDKSPVDEPKIGNPFSTLSTVGLSRILIALIELQEGRNDNTYKFLNTWVYDNAETKPGKPVFYLGPKVVQ